MNTLHRLLALPVLALTVATVHASTFANITVDGSYSDWDGIAASFTDANESLSKDIHQIFIANNDTHLFIRVTYNSLVNPQSGNGLFLGIDNDSNSGTGFNVYDLGVVGTEVAYQNDFPFQQAAGNFNTGATTNAPIAISPYGVETTSQEFSIVRTAIINTSTNALVFPNSSFNLVVYFNDSGNDLAGAASYTFAAVPEPSTFAALAGFGALSLAFFRRRR